MISAIPTRPSIGVVIPTFNQGAYLPACIESVLAQDYPATRVIVVNDGSTDDTESILHGFGSRIDWVTTTNSGVAAARNRGTDYLGTDLVAFCDSDDVWASGKLSEQVRRLTEVPGALWCHVGMELIDEEGTHLGFQIDGMEGWALDRLIKLREPAILGGGSGLIVDRSVLSKIGGFREDLSTSADWHLFARLAAISPVAFVATPLLRYRFHSEGMHNDVEVWRSDMQTAIRDLCDRGLISAQSQRRALAELGHQVAGELARRGELLRATQESARAVHIRPMSIGRCLPRVLPAARSIVNSSTSSQTPKRTLHDSLD